MSDPFVSEIRAFPFGFAPAGWAQCDGQLLSISQNTALFSLIGTTYGGDGKTTFALPDLRGSVPVSAGQGHGLSARQLGERGGTQAVTLLQTQMPAHSHSFNISTDLASERQPPGQVFAQGRGIGEFGPSSEPAANFSQGAIGFTGGNQPHNNLMPYLTVNYCIALQGTFPQRQ